MKKTNYIIENKINVNIKNIDDYIEIFNEKLALIIINLENKKINYYERK